MNLLLKLAWRNLWRNKRRTIITICAVVFAAMLAIAMRGIQIGTYEANIKHAVSLFSGYLQVQKDGYLDNPSLQKSFRFDGKLRTILASEEQVTGFTPRVNAQGLISYKENSMGALIFGIVPDSEANVSIFKSKLNQGSFIQTDSSYSIILGYKLLQNLNAEIGDTVVVLAQGIDGSLGNLKYKIAGTVKIGSPEFDGTAIFMGLSALQELLAMEGRVNSVAISLVSLNQVDAFQNKLKTYLPEDLDTPSWLEIMPDLKQSIELDNISGLIFLWILIVVVAFGILNAVLMSVTERFNEFGVALAMGMRNSTLVILVLIESFMIAVIGLIIGNIIALGINYYLFLNPIEFSGDFALMYEEYGFIPKIYSTLKPSVFINSTLNLLLISIVASFYPAFKVFKLEPLKGIRYT